MCNQPEFYEKIVHVYKVVEDDSGISVQINADKYGDVAVSGSYGVSHSPIVDPGAYPILANSSSSYVPESWVFNFRGKDTVDRDVVEDSILWGQVRVLFMRGVALETLRSEWDGNSPEGP